MRIKLLSNAGVGITLDGLTIYVDAFNNGSCPPYRATPRAVLETNEDADWLIFTHAHPDHFDEYMAAGYMASHTGCCVICDAEARARLIAAGAAPSRLHMFDDEATDTVLGCGVTLYAFNTRHIGVEYKHTCHHSLLIEGSRRVLITGDASPIHNNFDATARLKRLDALDVMAAPYIYVLYEPSNRLYASLLKPKQIFVVHIPDPALDAEDVAGRLKALDCSARPYAMTIPEAPLDSMLI